MMRSHFPVARVSALAAVAVAAFLIFNQRTSGLHWRALAPGVEFATLSGEPDCRSGSVTIAVLRLDPARVRLRVRHYTGEAEKRPLDIVAWQRRSGALAVFNAGQYYEDYSYMGLLAGGGRWISRRPHPTYGAALVVGPRGGGPRARVLDLTREPLAADSLGWDEVAQSLMLFDRRGTVRVRRSDKVANRTAVGEDRHGRLVVLTSEGGYTLRDFAELLRRPSLDLALAMAMDGGREAEMLVSAGDFRYASFGEWKPGAAPPAPPVTLPAVVTVEAR
jgi:uncharacterized protein YigE (DUF2233 family)